MKLGDMAERFLPNLIRSSVSTLNNPGKRKTAPIIPLIKPGKYPEQAES